MIGNSMEKRMYFFNKSKVTRLHENFVNINNVNVDFEAVNQRIDKQNRFYLEKKNIYDSWTLMCKEKVDILMYQSIIKLFIEMPIIEHIFYKDSYTISPDVFENFRIQYYEAISWTLTVFHMLLNKEIESLKIFDMEFSYENEAIKVEIETH